MFVNGSPHAVTDLWDVGAHHYNLKFTCPRCGHWRILHAAALWWLFRKRDWNGHLSNVPRRIVCGVCRSACGETERNPKMEIVSAEESGEPLPLPPEREWKLEAKRRR